MDAVIPEVTSFADRHAASMAAAALMAEALALDLKQQGQASLVVSGGTTPAPAFGMLAEALLDFERVSIVPSDERWVPPGHADSNETLVRNHLMTGAASAARFVPLYRDGLEPGDAPQAVTRDLDAMARPFSCVLLGMGEDGHFASLFPDFDGLSDALDPQGDASCVTVQTAGSPHVRISLTLAALLDARSIVLLFFGEAKRTVFEAAARDEGDFPVHALLRFGGDRITTIWAP